METGTLGRIEASTVKTGGHFWQIGSLPSSRDALLEPEGDARRTVTNNRFLLLFEKSALKATENFVTVKGCAGKLFRAEYLWFWACFPPLNNPFCDLENPNAIEAGAGNWGDSGNPDLQEPNKTSRGRKTEILNLVTLLSGLCVIPTVGFFPCFGLKWFFSFCVLTQNGCFFLSGAG